MSFAAVSAAQATDGAPPTVGTGNGHASAAPVCDTDKCPVLATEAPTGAGDNNGRSHASNTAGEWHPVLAGGKVTGSEFGH